ncbi:NADH-quinone oxidoreductase subunit C [Candidatus Liberibacter brunswickensis]|uniref:NADH-quinone oxidoreductase subunit C n=1 Tax=Candidatus Liberibacter brunswickensis TaxID=1968796 RepID=UPI002FE13662
MVKKIKNIGDYIVSSFDGSIELRINSIGELSIDVNRNELVSLCYFLRDDHNCCFVNIVDLCGVDFLSRTSRFDVVYHFLSPKYNSRVRVKVAISEGECVPSIIEVYPGAGWFEREVWDMYGIHFENHPDLRRILTDYGFKGHPLRKDFPVTGFVELHYDNDAKKVVYRPVELMQEHRDYDFLSPWEGSESLFAKKDSNNNVP